jgi:hypothetical protein
VGCSGSAQAFGAGCRTCTAAEVVHGDVAASLVHGQAEDHQQETNCQARAGNS